MNALKIKCGQCGQMLGAATTATMQQTLMLNHALDSHADELPPETVEELNKWRRLMNAVVGNKTLKAARAVFN